MMEREKPVAVISMRGDSGAPQSHVRETTILRRLATIHTTKPASAMPMIEAKATLDIAIDVTLKT